MSTSNNIQDVTNALKTNLSLINKQVTSTLGCNVNKKIDFDWDNSGFYISFNKDADVDFTVCFSACVESKLIGGGTEVVEFTNIELKSITGDSYSKGIFEVTLESQEDLIELGKDIALNANFYQLVDVDTHTTDSMNDVILHLYSIYE